MPCGGIADRDDQRDRCEQVLPNAPQLGSSSDLEQEEVREQEDEQ